MKKGFLFSSIILLCFIANAQTSEVIISVNWPNWSTENKVELYDPSGTLITPIISNNYGTSSDTPYDNGAGENYGFLIDNENNPNGTGYYVTVYDNYGDGWNNGGTMTITVDGATVVNFDGQFSASGSNIEITETFYFRVGDPVPPTAGDSIFDGSGNNYIEYIKGNLPIIISAPHGGTITSGALPNRSCGVSEPDDNTTTLIRAIQDEIYSQTGGYAHVIINNLNRIKLDPNRDKEEATCNNLASGIDNPLYYWNAWHGFIDEASASVEANWGKGLYIDLHGQSHSTPRIEIGYRISRTDLLNGDVSAITGTSITSLVSNNINGLTQEELVRGPNSLGALFHNAPGTYYASQNYPGCGRNGTNGYRATPSNYNFSSGNCNDTAPNNSNYFSGFYYNNERHGSGPAASDGLGGGGAIDGIMTEVNRRVRDIGSTLEPFAVDYANVVLDYINIHYNDFTGFSYQNSSYDLADSNPTPTLNTGVSGGLYLSSASGLVVDPDTGEIDLSSSTPGNYTVTYSVGPTSLNSNPNRYYASSQNITITDNTLTVSNFDKIEFKIYPNPTNGIVSFISTLEVNSIKVFNLLGQNVINAASNKTEDTINLKTLKTGTYIIKFYNNKSEIGSKMIIKN